MKYLHKILLAALASLPLVSCVEEEITKGEQENDSYGVYFKDLTPAQKNVEFDPDQKAELKFTAYRTSEADDIIVPLEIVAKNAKNEDASALFNVQELSFAEGQKEKDFIVSFPEAALGETYSVSVTCNDPEYVKIYAQVPTSFSFKVTRVKWNALVGANGEEFGSWKDDFFRSLYGVPLAINDKIKIEERADKKGYYRITDVYSPYMIAQFFDGATESDVAGNCTPGTITYVDATNPDKVWIKEGSTGATVNANDGYLLYASLCPENGFRDLSMYGILSDGVIRFPKDAIGLALTSAPEDWYKGNLNGETTIVLPGYRDFDYTLRLQTGLSNNGSLPFIITKGQDLTKVNYQFFEGKISDADIPFKALEVARNAEAESVTETSTLQAKLPKTGVYTLIAAGLDKDNTMQTYEVAVVGYVAENDEKPVILSCGIGSAAKYGAQGISTDTAVEIYLYGKDLTDVKFAVVSAEKFKADTKGTIAELLALPSAEPEILDAINGIGLSGAINKLLPGTEYILLAYACNGFEEKILASENSETTTGDPNPIYKEFNEVNMELLPETKDKYYGTYNVYAVDSQNNTGLRKLVSQVVLSDGGLVGEGKEMQDLVKVEHMWKPVADVIKIDDTFNLEFAGGVLYTIPAKFGQSEFQNMYAANIYLVPGTNSCYGADTFYAMYAGYAEEGFIPFFSNTEQELALTMGMYTDAEYKSLAGFMETYDNLLLINVNVDENAKEPEAKPAYVRLMESPMGMLNTSFTKDYRQSAGNVNLHTLLSVPAKSLHQAQSVKAELSEYNGTFETESQNIKLKSDLKVVIR